MGGPSSGYRKSGQGGGKPRGCSCSGDKPFFQSGIFLSDGFEESVKVAGGGLEAGSGNAESSVPEIVFDGGESAVVALDAEEFYGVAGAVDVLEMGFDAEVAGRREGGGREGAFAISDEQPVAFEVVGLVGVEIPPGYARAFARVDGFAAGGLVDVRACLAGGGKQGSVHGFAR